MGRFTDLSKAYYNYFSKVMNSYLNDTVPINAPFPYLTYELLDGEYSDNLLMTVRIYDKSTSVKTLNEYVDKLEGYIGNNLVEVNENNYFTVYKGSPFAQYFNDVEGGIKSVYINLQINVY